MTIRRLTFEIKKLANRCVQIKASAGAIGVFQKIYKHRVLPVSHFYTFLIFALSKK